MSIKTCIDSLVAAKEITLEDGQQLQKRFDALFRQLNSRGAAREALAKELEAEAREKKRRALLTETRRQVLTEAVLQHRDARGRQNPGEALVMLMTSQGGAKFNDLEHLEKVIAGEAHAKLARIMNEGRKGALLGDLRRRRGPVKAKLDNVVRELFGEASGDAAAKTMANAVSAVFEDLRQSFNDAGGAIQQLDKWGLPQHHDPSMIIGRRSEWIADLMGGNGRPGMLDRDRMVNPATGLAYTDPELRAALEYVYETITTGGWNKIEPSGASQGKGALFNRHQDHRFLHFANADQWLAYQNKYGRSDAYAAIMGHVSSMAKEIAVMRHLGPNPEAMRTYLKQLVEKHARMVRPLESIVDDLVARLEGEGDRMFSGVATAAARVTAAEAARGQARGHSGEHLAAGVFREILNEIRQKKIARSPDLRAKLDAKLDAALADYHKVLEDVGVGRDGLARQIRTARDTRSLFVAKPGKNPEDAATGAIHRFDKMWEAYIGASNVPVHEFWAQAGQSVRNVITAEAMGSASVTAISDMGRQKTARMMVGLMRKENSIGVIVGDYLNFLRRAPKEEALAAELLIDEALHVGHAQARYGAAANTRTVTGFLADRTLGLSGMNWITQTGKHLHGMWVQTQFGMHRAKPFAELPDGLVQILDRHGIDAAAWDAVRAAPAYEPRRGVAMIRPKEIREAAGVAANRMDRTEAQRAAADLAERWQVMIMREVSQTIPEAGLRWRSYMAEAGRPGSGTREFANFALQFKSFGITVILLDLARIAREIGAGRVARGAGYAAGTLVFMGVFGGLAAQIKEIVQGRDPRDMTSAKFWGAALLQGGGFGIVGDLMFADYNRAGGSGVLNGPLESKLETIARWTLGQARRGVEDEKTNPGKAAMGVVRSVDPGLGSLWYTRLAYERLILDRIQAAIDPDAHKGWHRMARQRRKQFGNGWYWPPGSAAPDRGPDLGAAFTGTP